MLLQMACSSVISTQKLLDKLEIRYIVDGENGSHFAGGALKSITNNWNYSDVWQYLSNEQ